MTTKGGYSVRILFIAHRFPPYTGGTPGRVYRISRGLSLRGHEVVVCTSTHPRVPRIQETEGLRVERYDLLHPAIARFMKSPYYIMPGMIGLLGKRKEPLAADIVQTFNFLSYVSFIGAGMKLLRKRIFALSPIIMHHSEFLQEFRSIYERKGTKAFLSDQLLTAYFLTFGVGIVKCADLVFPQTRMEKNVLVDYGVDPDKIKVVPGGVSVEYYRKPPDPSSFKEEYAIDSDEKLVLFVGEPTLWKGTHHVMLAMREVLEKVGKARLVFVSASVDKVYRQLKRFGSSSVRSRILVTGPLVGERLVSAYSAADALILPSRGEGFGTVIVEALASGLPVVSTRTGVARDILIHGKNGLFVKYGKVRQISEAIIRVLSDETFKMEAKRDRQSILESYDSEREIESYERAYYDIIGQRGW